MLKLTVSGLAELRADLAEWSDRRFAAALATGLTRTAVEVRNATRDAAIRELDRPTPYTLRQLRYVAASADRLRAGVGFNIAAVSDQVGQLIEYRQLGPGETPAGKYLQFQTEGGTRKLKRFEAALQRRKVLPVGWVTVPGERAQVDAYGNQAVGEIKQILSWFDAMDVVLGSTQNMGDAGRAKRRKGTRRRAGFEYFAVQPGRPGLPGGIYRRTRHALGAQVEPVMIFVRQSAYRPRYSFYETAQRVADEVMPVQIRRAIEESAARLKRRGG